MEWTLCHQFWFLPMTQKIGRPHFANEKTLKGTLLYSNEKLPSSRATFIYAGLKGMEHFNWENVVTQTKLKNIVSCSFALFNLEDVGTQ
jgi:hypothetical protein